MLANAANLMLQTVCLNRLELLKYIAVKLSGKTIYILTVLYE